MLFVVLSFGILAIGWAYLRPAHDSRIDDLVERLRMEAQGLVPGELREVSLPVLAAEERLVLISGPYSGRLPPGHDLPRIIERYIDDIVGRKGPYGTHVFLVRGDRIAAEHWIDGCTVGAMGVDAIVASPRHRRLIMVCDRPVEAGCAEHHQNGCEAELVRAE
jgi:hypothetical protein